MLRYSKHDGKAKAGMHVVETRCITSLPKRDHENPVNHNNRVQTKMR